ncbi:MAG TPA: GNAT family N-acetyltransferase, partial [Pyrinomonadaceae bacterium]|nr:GNAT family N-acetyltransferase [Pyrinomonadaceae bacterium]
MLNNRFKSFSINLSNTNSASLTKKLSTSLINDFIYPKIRNFLLESSSIYTDIDVWWEKTVKSGLSSGERVCNVVFDDDEIIAVSIGKFHRKSSKLCTLKVNESYRNLGLGHKLLAKTAQQLIESGCKKVHFTVSDEIKNQIGEFFSNYGFNLISWEQNRYSNGHEELVFASSARDLINSF